jgi:outer membrane autotransporter protein
MEEIVNGSSLISWKKQVGPGTQSISHDDKVVLTMTAPVISESGRALIPQRYGYSAVTAQGGNAEFNISGTKGVTITTIGNPVITSDPPITSLTDDERYKRSNVLLAWNEGSITVTSSDGDVSLNIADELPPDGRDGSYNLLGSFGSQKLNPELHVVQARVASKVLLTGKNVTVSILGKQQADGTRYYDPAIQYDYNYGIDMTQNPNADDIDDRVIVKMIATDGDNRIIVENTGYRGTYALDAGHNSYFLARALKGDNILSVKSDPLRKMSNSGGYHVASNSRDSDIMMEGINNTLLGEGGGGYNTLLDTYGNVGITAEKDNHFLTKAASTGTYIGLITRSQHGGDTPNITVTANTGNNMVYLDPSSAAGNFVGIYEDGNYADISLSAPHGENRVIADIDPEAARQTLARYEKTPADRIYFTGIKASAGDSLITLDSQRNIVEIFPSQLGAETSVQGVAIQSDDDFPYLGYQSTVILKAQQDNIVRASTCGIKWAGYKNQINLEAVHGDNVVYGGGYGVRTYSPGFIRLHTEEGNNSITSDGTAMEVNNWGEATLTADSGDNVVRGKDYAALASQGGQITIDSPQGANYLLADGTAVDIKCGGTAEITITGQSVIEGKDAALKTEYSKLPWRTETTEGGTIQVNYDGSSSITGDVYGMNGGTIHVVPHNEGTMTLTGNIYGADETMTLSDFDEMPAFELVTSGQGVRTVNKAWASPVPGGTVNVELSSGSRMTGSADTGSHYARTLLERRKATFDEKLAEAHDAALAQQEMQLGHSLTEEEEAQFEADWNQNVASNYDKETVFRQFEEDAADTVGTISITLNDGALWLMTGSSSITALGGNGGTVYYQDGGDALEIGTLSGSHTFALDLNAEDHSQSDMIYVVNGTSDTQTLAVKNLDELDSQMGDGDSVRFATVKNPGGGFTEGRSYYAANGLYNDALTVDYRLISEDPDADENYDGGNKPSQEAVASVYGGDDAVSVYLVRAAKEETNDGAVTPAKSRDIVWRYVTDLDSYTNRTGQSQYFTPGADQGGWIRLRYRNLGVDNVGEVDGNTYELGYTTVSRQNDERKHRFSASVSYGKETGSWEGYGGDLKIRDFAVSLFDTHEYYPDKEEMAKKPAWKQGTHSYWDNYFKYHHVKTEYSAIDHHTGLQYDGDYNQNVYNLSTEYGRINKLNEKWSIVPQAQLQLSYLGGYDYTDSQGLQVDGDHDWSLIGRLGFDLVDKLDAEQDNKLYFKASLLHEFFDGNDVTVSASGDSIRHEGDQSGTWGVVGLGYSSKIGNRQYFYLDAERYFGNDFDRTYNIRAGVNWKF